MYIVLFLKYIYLIFLKPVIKQSNVKERDPTSNYDLSMYTDDDPLYAECSRDLSSYSQEYSQEYSHEYNLEYSHEPLYSTVNKKKKKSGRFTITYSMQSYSPNKKPIFTQNFKQKIKLMNLFYF